MKYRRLLLLTIPVAGLLVWLGSRQYAAGDGSLPPLNVERVEIGTVSQRVVAHGSLQPVRKVTVGSQVSGIVDQVFVDFNSRVRRGQVLARIEPSMFQAAKASAEAELEAAEAALELARHQYQRTQELRERQFVAPSEVDQARATLRQAEAQLQVRRHALDRARRELARCTITAPTDGIVISRSVDVGQTVAASLNAPELFELATDLSRMHIHANVSEADIGHVAEGQMVRFVVDAHRNRTFSGEVVQVRNAPLVMDNVVHYETIIAVENEEGLLKPGMTAEVSIITAEKENVLRVRNPALRARLPDALIPAAVEDPGDRNGRVFVLRNGGLVAAAVMTGLSDGVYTEIVEGLIEGDTLAVGLSLRGQSGDRSRSIISGNQAQY
jgi:HlyD family secretion protein